MRIARFVVVLIVSISWVWLLNSPHGSLPALGKLLHPVTGFWSNAEPVAGAAKQFHFPDNKYKTIAITFDERLVPHIKARNDYELYLAQGYLHAYYRLWQMDMQTRAAAGRISEVAGNKAFEFDRKQRRKGMVWAAENSLHAMEANSTTRAMLEAYTEGVNLYIDHLKYQDYPLEYKLMGFAPERWTHLKCALLQKYMADDLTGGSDDIAMTYLRDAMPAKELEDLFPDKIKLSQPVIPAGTYFPAPSLRIPPVPRGDLFAHFDTAVSNARLKKQEGEKLSFDCDDRKSDLLHYKSSSGIGSNNWAIGGGLTSDSAAILCNDPHLGLNLPSVWYELQMTAPGINCYGVSIPGAPGIVIGFNDSISWGFTNNYRDVKDFYEIKSSDPRLYIFDGKDVPFNERYEKIFIKGQEKPFIDTIRFTIHGPLMYDEQYSEPSGSGKLLAMCWMGHRATNELLAIYGYNRAQNYNQWVDAIRHFECPAQNFAFADRYGNIAIWGQGRYINKWKDQGKYVMRGDISATLWGDTIPMAENPHVFNPPQGYVASANQNVTDYTYPYWYNGDFTEFRSWEINYYLIFHFCKKQSELTVNLDGLDPKVVPLELYKRYFLFDSLFCGVSHNDIYINACIQNLNASFLANALNQFHVGKVPSSIKDDNILSASSKSMTFFKLFWSSLYNNIWQDEFKNFPDKLYPSAERTMFLVLDDTASRYFDDVTTPQKETMKDIVALSYKQAKDSFDILEKEGIAAWYKVKNTSVTHLAKLPAFSFTGLKTGGDGNAINAMKQNHGPSWRMIVQMKRDSIHAYVVYPGGQSGNPGSRYYADFLNYWVEGKYYEAKFYSRK